MQFLKTLSTKQIAAAVSADFTKAPHPTPKPQKLFMYYTSFQLQIIHACQAELRVFQLITGKREQGLSKTVHLREKFQFENKHKTLSIH